MHRVDIARATGRDLVLTPDHDGRIVADVVAGAGEAITIDAVEFCRTLSGRTPGTGLLAQEVPF